MPRRERTPTKGGWRAIALSVILHSGIVAAAIYGWFTWKHRPPPVEAVAIEAQVVDESALRKVAPAPTPQPPPPEPTPPEPTPPEPTPPVEEQGPPKPDPAEVERQQKLEQEKQEQLRLDAEKQAAAEKERLEAEKKAAAEKAAAEKKAQEKKKADDAAAAKKAADEKARLAREAELRRMMEAEERGNQLRGSEEAARWHAAIVARITRAWIAPPSAQPGVSCIVMVSQNQGGEVLGVRVESCSINDPALKESVETAVKRASPLPAPPNPALFEPNLKLIFAPQ